MNYMLSKYHLQVKFFLGTNNSNGIFVNNCFLFVHCARSFCHIGMS